jgi:hypothetical protein
MSSDLKLSKAEILLALNTVAMSKECPLDHKEIINNCIKGVEALADPLVLHKNTEPL